MTAPLLTTKLYIPPARASRVARPHLLDRLNAGLQPGGRLILLSAPAGFGKTSLLAEWIAHKRARIDAPARSDGDEVRFCWLSLDEGDNDPPRFLRYLIAALQTASAVAKPPITLGEAALALLQAPVGAEGLVSTEAVLNALLNDLAGALPGGAPETAPGGAPETASGARQNALQPFYCLCLVLDDYHVIESPEVHAAVSYLIDHLPPCAHLVIATRSDPPLPFPRLRARDQVIELRVHDLRFSDQEAAAFLNEVMQLDLSAEDVAALEARTEGWVAGLQLASLAARATPDRAALSSFVAAFAGSNRYILDYLVEEVLARQTEEVQEFLLQTAVLERFCAELCEYVIRDSVIRDSESGQLPSSLITNYESRITYSSQIILETLERSNLFIVPLDGERRWYRYHNLFAEFLYSRLCAVLDQARVRALHRRASAWFERQDLAYEAIEYALKAGDYARAAELIERKARWAVLTPGETGRMLRWLDAIPEEIAMARPGLCLIHAWVLLTAGHNPAAEPYVAAAVESAAAHPEGYDTDEIRSEAAALRSLLAVMAGQLDNAIRLAHQALEHLPENALVVRGMVTFNLGLTYDMRGDVAAAAPVYRQAVAIGQAANMPLITLITAVQLADLELLQGRPDLAEASYQQAVALADRLGGLPVTAMAYSGLGHILYEQNRLDEAARQLEKAIELGRRWESTDILVISLIYLAQVRLARGQPDEALALVSQAEAGLLGNLSSLSTLHSARAYLARLWLLAGQVAAAAQWAREFQEKPAAFPQAYLRVIEGATLVRVLLAQGKPGEAAENARRLLEGVQPGQAVELGALLALAYQAQGQDELAVQTLHETLLHAAPSRRGNQNLDGSAVPSRRGNQNLDGSAATGGYARTFIDEGAPMARLLHKALARGANPAYVTTLLDAFPPEMLPEQAQEDAALFANAALIEPLSDRELDVLRLVGQGLTNQAIAARLVIAVSTVKTHINNIYGKLGVETRVQAILKAREMRIIE